MSDLTDRTSALLDDARGRRRLAEIIAVAHALTALLIITDRAGYSARPVDVVGGAAEHPAWALLHLVVGVAMGAAATYRRTRAMWLASCASIGVMGGWSVLMLVWAVRLDPDATWGVALGGGVVTVLSAVLADRED